jgi:hypothetical protein
MNETTGPDLRRTHRVAAATLLAATLCAPAAGFELALSAGVDDLRGGPQAAAGLELRGPPLWRPAAMEIGLAAAAEADRDVWTGAGPILFAPLGPRWRLEASVMLGVYFASRRGSDLGTDFPVFRSQLGASRAFAGAWRLGLSVNHKSNASTARRNPGVETVLVSLARSF